MIDFVSNDYLGLSVIDAELNDGFGATGSRLISGNTPVIESVEAELAVFFGSPAALCFNSGYDANLGIFASIPQKGDVVLYDAHVHASVRDGIRLSNADAFSFKHNDLEDLERLLTKFSGQTIYVAVEGLYSMGGDIAPIGKISKLVENYGGYLIVDEAHSGGVFGEDGKGITHAFQCVDLTFIRLMTFGKAYGGHGAVVLCSAELREFLINFSRSFIYTTALPASVYRKMEASVKKTDLNERRRQLQANIGLFVSKLNSTYLFSEINSPIQIIKGLDLSSLRLLQSSAKERGLGLKLVYPPTVKEGEESIRICIHSFNTSDEISKLVDLLNEYGLGPCTLR
eukprot:Opistho-1_new@7438